MLDFDRSVLVHATNTKTDDAIGAPWVIGVHIVAVAVAVAVGFFAFFIEWPVHLIIPVKVIVGYGADFADVNFGIGFARLFVVVAVVIFVIFVFAIFVFTIFVFVIFAFAIFVFLFGIFVVLGSLCLVIVGRCAFVLCLLLVFLLGISFQVLCFELTVLRLFSGRSGLSRRRLRSTSLLARVCGRLFGCRRVSRITGIFGFILFSVLSFCRFLAFLVFSLLFSLVADFLCFLLFSFLLVVPFSFLLIVTFSFLLFVLFSFRLLVLFGFLLFLLLGLLLFLLFLGLSLLPLCFFSFLLCFQFGLLLSNFLIRFPLLLSLDSLSPNKDVSSSSLIIESPYLFLSLALSFFFSCLSSTRSVFFFSMSSFFFRSSFSCSRSLSRPFSCVRLKLCPMESNFSLRESR